MEDVKIIKGSSIDGITLKESLRRISGGHILAIKKKSGHLITNPSLDFVVSNGGLQGFEVNSSSTTITGGIDIISYNRTSPGYTPMVMNASVFSILTGSVGIGTTNPLALLNVKGASFTGPGANKGIVYIHDELNSGLSFGCYNASPYGSWIQGLDANSSGVYPLILQPIGGYVGIGTTVPGYKLDVNTPIVPATDTYSGFQLQTDNYGYLFKEIIIIKKIIWKY